MSISVRLDPETEVTLRQRLRSHQISLSGFVRESIQEKLVRSSAQQTPYELGHAVFGRYGSGDSGRRKTLVRQRVNAKRHR